jgi:ribosomal protein S18 acetylase RimI-like enzyme
MSASNPAIFDWQITQNAEGFTPDVFTTLKAATDEAQMIKLTPEVLQTHSIGVLALRAGEVAGYSAIMLDAYKYTDPEGVKLDACELGGAIVLPKFRRQGLASAMADKRLEELQRRDYHGAVVSFTNETSRGYIERAGLKPLTAGATLSEEAFALCEGCNECPLVGLKPIEDPTVCCDYDGIRVTTL